MTRLEELIWQAKTRFTASPDALLAALIEQIEADQKRIAELGAIAATADIAPEQPITQHAKQTDISRELREYAKNPGYSHNDYADTMLAAADEIERHYGGMLAWKAAADAALAQSVQPTLEGREISVDVSTGDNDAGNRIYATLTGETAGDGETLIAIEDSRNFGAQPAQPAQSAMSKENLEDIITGVIARNAGMSDPAAHIKSAKEIVTLLSAAPAQPVMSDELRMVNGEIARLTELCALYKEKIDLLYVAPAARPMMTDINAAIAAEFESEPAIAVRVQKVFQSLSAAPAQEKS